MQARDVLQTLIAHPGEYACIDVRSEGEFDDGHIEGFTNAPILNNAERRAVGTVYKQDGQDAAIALGHKLVDPHRTERVSRWLEITVSARNRHAFLSCWRGGLRSQIASQWIRDAGGSVETIAGGYKAMRRVALEAIENVPSLVRIGGMTGSGKTELLHAVDSAFVIDLEKHARHRGSAFGKPIDGTQPGQASFENSIGLSILSGHDRLRLVENESITIGSVHLPFSFAAKMRESPLIILDAPLAERAERIAKEYVTDRLNTGFSKERLRDEFSRAFEAIRKRLGGLLTDQIKAQMTMAFASTAPEAHHDWIAILLREYYDRRYAWSAERTQAPILMRGDFKTCRQWIYDRFASLKP